MSETSNAKATDIADKVQQHPSVLDVKLAEYQNKARYWVTFKHDVMPDRFQYLYEMRLTGVFVIDKADKWWQIFTKPRRLVVVLETEVNNE